MVRCGAMQHRGFRSTDVCIHVNRQHCSATLTPTTRHCLLDRGYRVFRGLFCAFLIPWVVREEVSAVVFLPPLLKEDSVFGQAKVHEGLGDGLDHGRGSTQVPQSPLGVHVSLQLCLCDPPTWEDSEETQPLTLTLTLLGMRSLTYLDLSFKNGFKNIYIQRFAPHFFHFSKTADLQARAFTN